MKFNLSTQKTTEAGAALAMVMIMMAIALAILASVMVWTSSSTKLTHRSIQYTRSVAAAEAATEKAVTQITQDFLAGGIRLTDANLNSYRLNSVPTTTDSPYWSTWVFDDGTGNLGQIYVSRTPGNNYVVLGSTYAGLQGYVSTYTVVSHASENDSPQQVNAGVLQQLQLTGIPIFQFMMYSSDDMEISCGQPFTVMGRVHSNGALYVEPDSTLTFVSGVTAVTGILDQREPLDTRGTPAGLQSLVYEDLDPEAVLANSDFLTLPIGTSNSPTAIREIIEPPPPGEDPTSPLGLLRYYNECDMLVVVSNNSVVLRSGSIIDTNAGDINLLVSTTNSFIDDREGKTVAPIDLNVGNLAIWSQTNNRILNLSSVYIVDNRNNLPANTLEAVRVTNGTNLPPNGLTVATARPLYVLGDYNQYSLTNMGTTNTSTTRPASLVADAITILSDNWSDANSSGTEWIYESRPKRPSTPLF